MDYESNIALLKDTVRDNIQFIQYEAENGTDDDTKLLEYIDECILEIPEYITLRDRIRLRNDVYNSLRRYDVLSELLEDDSISDIMINGAGDIFIEHNGHMERSTKVFENTRKLEDIIQILVADSDRRSGSNYQKVS